MDGSATAAAWLSVFVTSFGLISLLSQTNSIRDLLDPFRESRGRKFLGPFWALRQPRPRALGLPFQGDKPPIGPVINANLREGFCGEGCVRLSRLPTTETGLATWTAVLGIVHADERLDDQHGDFKRLQSNTTASFSIPETFSSLQAVVVEKSIHPAPTSSRIISHQWTHLPSTPLLRHAGTTCIPIKRATLIVLLLMTNARPIYDHKDAAGLRASYASYNGLWTIVWPLGEACRVSFSPHDSHQRGTDVYPEMFSCRVSKCIDMLAGVVAAGTFKVAFPGRCGLGTYVLDYVVKGFPGAHGSRHLYNMMGGKVYEVDRLVMRRTKEFESGNYPQEYLTVPVMSHMKHTPANVLINKTTAFPILLRALDNLPWSSLSWSIHRGLRDLLLAIGTPTMNACRSNLASQLRRAVLSHPDNLIAAGWDADFAHTSLPDMVSGAILAERGNSGDLVRCVTDVVEKCICGDSWTISDLDSTSSWQDNEFFVCELLDAAWARRRREGEWDEEEELGVDQVIALTKFFVLEWSVEFDYQMYHDLPIEILMQ